MGLFDGILICTDLDGTLLKKDKSISENNLKAINFFQKEGGNFTIMTGRMPTTAFEICEKIKLKVPFGCINGGAIYDYYKKEYVWAMPLSHKVINLVDWVEKNLPTVGIQLNTDKDIYFCRDSSALVKFREDTKAPNIFCDYHKNNEKFLKIVFGEDDEETILTLADKLNSHPLAPEFSFVRSDNSLYEILPPNISKAVAFNKMVEIYGYDYEKTIAVGDYYNDISLVMAAKTGIAVANACDELKGVADYITVSNEEDAIAKVIEDIYYGRL